MFTRIQTVRNAEAKIEVKCLEKFVFKKVPLNHSEVLNRLVTHTKFDSSVNDCKYEIQLFNEQMVDLKLSLRCTHSF